MSALPGGFGADWLALREPFDRAARNTDLAQRFVKALDQVTVPTLVDLGCGTAANFRSLAPKIARDQRWRIIDRDASLLDAAIAQVASWARAKGWSCHQPASDQLEVSTSGCGRWTLTTVCFDLSSNMELLALDACDAFVTTAFLDLVSQSWVERLVQLLCASPRPLLATLTVDGRRDWFPPHENDALMQLAFNQHQLRNKGLGPALGIAATGVVAQALSNGGFEVTLGQSNWKIGFENPEIPDAGNHHAMLSAMITEAVSVALDMQPEASLAIHQWHKTRCDQLEQQQLLLMVGHQDLLALHKVR